MERLTERNRGFAITVGSATGDVARAIRALSDVDLARLKALARLWSRGLPGSFDWTDVLNEAIVRVLDGSRPWPPGVPLLAFLSGVMRSICEDQWRRVRRERLRNVDLAELGASTADAPADPERVLVAAQAVVAVHRLFASDPTALKIVSGLSEGLAAEDIRRCYGLSECEYDTAHKRMRRALLRSGFR